MPTHSPAVPLLTHVRVPCRSDKRHLFTIADTSILYMKCRAVLRLALAPVVEAGGGDVGVAEPLLDFGDVGFV